MSANKYLYKITSGNKETMWSPHIGLLLVSMCGVSSSMANSKGRSLVRLIHRKTAIKFSHNGVSYWLMRKPNEQ